MSYNVQVYQRPQALSGLWDWLRGAASGAWDAARPELEQAAQEAGDYLRQRIGADAYASLTPEQRRELEREYARQRLAAVQPDIRRLLPFAALAAFVYFAR